MQIQHPYHEGELAVQRRVGEDDLARHNGSAISDTIVRGALPFIEQQPMAVFGSVDGVDNVWASLLVGEAGFLNVVDERTVELDLSKLGYNHHDPLWANLDADPRVGVLLIELATRRRLRINGDLRRASPTRLRLDVTESYPNCPKYIQRRHTRYNLPATERGPAEPRDGTNLEPAQKELIGSADTFFVASAHPTRGTDASHRGGRPGFVRILDKRHLRIPDYAGNSMYNTLGNLEVHPRAGLVFLDFRRNLTLQLIGRAEILVDHEDLTGETGGTGRFWDVHIDHWLESELPRQLSWEFLDYSTHNPTP